MTEQHDIRAFIFDLDGVLTDTSELHYHAWQRFCDEEGIPFDRQRNEGLRGVHRLDAMRGLLADRPVDEESLNEMLDRKNRYYLERLAEVTPSNLLPGARRFLGEVRAAGLKIAVASASRNAPEVVQRLGIADELDALSDGNSVSRSKPAPDLFLHAADQLGVAPDAAVVVEDAEAGVDAGINGGMRVIGLGPEERVGRAHLVMPDLSQASLHAVMSTLLRVPPPAPKPSDETQ
jgi:beta-phosphoglucomutase